MAVTLTPNIGLQIPAYGTGNWQVPMNYNLAKLDLLLSGNLPLAGFEVIGELSFAPNATTPADAGITRTAPGVLKLGNGTSGDATASVYAGAFHGDGSGITGVVAVPSMPVQANGAVLGSANAFNFAAFGSVSLASGVATVTPPLLWVKFVLAISGANWTINGAIVAARSSAGTTQQIALMTTGLRQPIHGLVIKHAASFLPSGACTVTVGTAAVPDALMTAPGDTFEVDTAVADTIFYATGGVRMLSFGAVPIILQIFNNASTPSALTSGSLEVDLLLATLP